MSEQARRRSASVFNNDKFADVVLALHDERAPATAQQIARAVGINHDLARKVLVRLADAGLVKTLPRFGGRRGPLPYEAQPGPEWDALTALCALLASPRPAQ